MQVLKSIIEKYTQRITDNVPSFFARIIGVFKIKVNHSNAIYVILMENLRCGMNNPLIFDLKGSTINRRVTKHTYDSIEHFPKIKVYKDIDLLNSMIQFQVNANEFANIIRSIEIDTLLLETHLIMDYSLLVLIEEASCLRGPLIRRGNYFTSGKYIICIAIIDFFQAYNTKKKMENRYKSFKSNVDGTISSIPPKPYKKRFIEMISKIFIPTQEAKLN